LHENVTVTAVDADSGEDRLQFLIDSHHCLVAAPVIRTRASEVYPRRG
jgi:hypothetical protein